MRDWSCSGTCEITASDLNDSGKTKSDQLNADDLIRGTMTGKIVRITKSGDPAQPFRFQLSCWHVPWIPCKTERRVMIAMWGDDPRAWMGQTIRLKRDATVAFGRENVGGIRIEAASGIKGEVSLMLNKTKGAKARRTVVELTNAEPSPTVAPLVLPKWAEQGNEPLSPEQAEEIVSMAAAHGIKAEQLAGKFGSPESWGTESARGIVKRLQEVATQRRGGGAA